MGKSCVVLGIAGVLFFVGIVGFVVMLGGGIFLATSGIVNTADEFLVNASMGELEIARESLTENYSNSLSDEEFAALVDQFEIDDYSTVFWNHRSVENSSGKLEGSFTTNDSQSVPLNLHLVYEQGDWRISKIERPGFEVMNMEGGTKLTESESTNIAVTPASNSNSEDSADENEPDGSNGSSESKSESKLGSGSDNSGVDQDESSPSSENVLSILDIPDEQVAVEIVRKWTDEFCQGVSKKDFSKFHSQTSTLFQQQIPLEKFTEIFQDFITKEVNLDWIKDVAPTFADSPTLDANGVLRIAGKFVAEPTVDFDYHFVQENSDWKPLKVSLSVDQDVPNRLPSLERLNSIANETTTGFGEAVKNKDFTDFYAQLATDFKKQYPLKDFTKTFRSFVLKNADLQWVGSASPEFLESPSLNADGVLQLIGNYSVDPPVRFKYVYFWEEGKWRIISINISIPPAEPTEEKSAPEDESADSGQSD